MFKCDKCNKNFAKKSNYERHLERKNPCDEVMSEYACEYCEYTTNRKSNFIKHRNRKKPCGTNNDLQILQNMQDRLLNNDTTTFKQELNNLYKKHNNNNITITNNNTNNGTIVNGNNNTINVIINPFGKEDLSHIDNKKAKRILNNGLLAVSKYIEYVHQDMGVPQNHNLYIGGWNSRSDVNMYDGKKWVVVDKNDVIPQVIDNCMDFINDKIEELDETDPEDEKILRMANRLKKAYDNNDVGKLKCVAKEIQKTLYNNREIIKDTMKKQKFKQLKDD